MGCKRILISNDYYEAFDRPNVQLHHGVKVRTVRNGLTLQDSSGIRTLDIDTLIFGTGFAATDFLATVDISGAGGLSLKSAWATAPTSILTSHTVPAG